MSTKGRRSSFMNLTLIRSRSIRWKSVFVGLLLWDQCLKSSKTPKNLLGAFAPPGSKVVLGSFHGALRNASETNFQIGIPDTAGPAIKLFYDVTMNVREFYSYEHDVTVMALPKGFEEKFGHFLSHPQAAFESKDRGIFFYVKVETPSGAKYGAIDNRRGELFGPKFYWKDIFVVRPLDMENDKEFIASLQVSETKGSETKGSETKWSETKWSETKGSETKGSETEGSSHWKTRIVAGDSGATVTVIAAKEVRSKFFSKMSPVWLGLVRGGAGPDVFFVTPSSCLRSLAIKFGPAKTTIQTQ